MGKDIHRFKGGTYWHSVLKGQTGASINVSPSVMLQRAS